MARKDFDDAMEDGYTIGDHDYRYTNDGHPDYEFGFSKTLAIILILCLIIGFLIKWS